MSPLCHSALAMLVTHLLTNSCLINLIDVTMACEDANPKLVDVVTVADFDFRLGWNTDVWFEILKL